MRDMNIPYQPSRAEAAQLNYLKAYFRLRKNEKYKHFILLSKQGKSVAIQYMQQVLSSRGDDEGIDWTLVHEAII